MISIECADNMAYMARFPNGFFDIGLVDPPYGLNGKTRSGIGRLNSGGGKMKGRYANRTKVFWDQLPPPEYWVELKRVTKNQIVFGGNYFELPPTRGIVVWDKMNTLPTFSACELIWTSYDKPAKIIRVSATGGSKELERRQVTQKPVAVYSELLKLFSKPGFKILDTHLGSGTIAEAAILLDVDLYACEIDQDVFNKTDKYIKLLQTQQKIIFNP